MAVKQRSQTLSRSQNELSDTLIQLDVLNDTDKLGSNFVPFDRMLKSSGHDQGIIPVRPDIFQINIGKLCNQACAHCHVDAGPDKKVENMDRSTLEKCLRIVTEHNIPTVDITGGAPEMNPHFRWFVEACREAGINVINRCNLTIIEAHKKYADLPDFFAKYNVEIVSSLPYFTATRTDNQRGDGVFEASIAALKKLNAVGYGEENTGLTLNLVYNPSGAFLPGNQQELETEFKRQLKRRHDIEFNNLFAITNLPVSRFLDYLVSTDNYEQYMTELIDAYNPATIDELMCRNTMSISWDGYIYDCDFNQMLNLKSATPSNHLDTFDMETFVNRQIVVNQHCYGCTAGAGSSCGGNVA